MHPPLVTDVCAFCATVCVTVLRGRATPRCRGRGRGSGARAAKTVAVPWRAHDEKNVLLCAHPSSHSRKAHVDGHCLPTDVAVAVTARRQRLLSCPTVVVVRVRVASRPDLIIYNARTRLKRSHVGICTRVRH